MSTYLFLECLDHDPAIRSRDEVGQHLSDLPAIREWLATPAADLPDPDGLWNYATGGDDYFGSRAVWFLTEHPGCRLGIRDEYGAQYTTERES